MLKITSQDISRNFGERDCVRGRTYQNQGRVVGFSVDNDGYLVNASVKGTAPRPYEVEVVLKHKNGKLAVYAECTCPVGYMCKHCAAALFEYAARENRSHEKLAGGFRREASNTPQLSGSLTAWLKKVNQQAQNFDFPAPEQKLIYVIGTHLNGRKPETTITPCITYMIKDGRWSKPKPYSIYQLKSIAQTSPTFNDDDKAIVRIISATMGPYSYASSWSLPEDPDLVDIAMKRVALTGRAYHESDLSRELSLGADAEARLSWVLTENAKQRPGIVPEDKRLSVLGASSPWYVDLEQKIIGKLKISENFETIAKFLEAPVIDNHEAGYVGKLFKENDAPYPAPYQIVKDTEKAVVPKAMLKLAKNGGLRSVRVVYDYEGSEIEQGDRDENYKVINKDKIVIRKRDFNAEKKALDKIEESGLFSEADSPWKWMDFVREKAPVLRSSGIGVEIGADFIEEVVEPDSDDIEASFTQNGEWWFSLDLGITVEGQKVQLLPILVSLLREIRGEEDIEKLGASKKCYAPLPDGRRVALPSDRVKTILRTLIELYGDKPLDDKGRLNVSLDLAAAISKIDAITAKRWLTDERLRRLVEKLSDFSGIKSVAVPKGLKAELRHYQKQGYDWLHFLGEYGLSGILADDMGLGKTVQALAYVLSMKRRDVLKNPCLVVMPTSLVANWQSEAARFAPELKILTLHGKDRAEKFEDIADADIVFTTYPLIIRDIEVLRPLKWSLIILDEAQAIKNPAAKMTQAVCTLNATQRLCLTGTPVENHLGEAWSLFSFLMPGLLGTHKSFSKLFRSPIEKLNDGDRRGALARRLRPFVLRRLKNEVEKELPPKTEIITKITLSDEQRDLYESVRHAMSDTVRAEIAAKGLARSHIVILDALLKLRQVCCDPRLVKISAARKVKTSSKLEELMEMLPTLIEEGRKILLFSQFTSMLDLIKPELEKSGIEYVELRGTTKDRKTPVSRFQKGEVPLFLISLKAGGTGLNLTAADTVIHYDPWWNPSVENQATDRAHRIGQDKPVFVYKLIAEGTVEERIVELQKKKAGLAAAIFGDNPSAAASLSHDDLNWLMAE